MSRGVVGSETLDLGPGSSRRGRGSWSEGFLDLEDVSSRRYMGYEGSIISFGPGTGSSRRYGGPWTLLHHGTRFPLSRNRLDTVGWDPVSVVGLRDLRLFGKPQTRQLHGTERPFNSVTTGRGTWDFVSISTHGGKDPGTTMTWTGVSRLQWWYRVVGSQVSVVIHRRREDHGPFNDTGQPRP